MHARTMERYGRYPYFEVTLDEEAGRMVQMRQPRTAHMGIARASLLASSQDRIAERFEDAELGGKLKIAAEAFVGMGALIGCCWADTERALDAHPADGAAVIDELIEAGYSRTDLVVLWARCVQEVGRDDVRLIEALNALGFTHRRPASGADSSGGQGSNTSATSTVPSA